MTVRELLKNKEINGIGDYLAIDHLRNNRIGIIKDEKHVSDFESVLDENVIDYIVRENNRIVIYI